MVKRKKRSKKNKINVEINLNKQLICGLCHKAINPEREAWVALIDFLKTKEKNQTYYHNLCMHEFLLGRQRMHELMDNYETFMRGFAVASAKILKSIKEKVESETY